MPDQSTCPSCNGNVSPKAFDCPHCGHPIRKAKRGFFGKIFKGLFILFNILMVIWLFAGLVNVGEVIDGAATESEQGWAAVGGTIGVGLLLVFWVLGDIILGLLTILTRPRK